MERTALYQHGRGKCLGSLHSASVAMAPSSSVEMTKRGLRSRAKQNRCCRKKPRTRLKHKLRIAFNPKPLPFATPGEGADHLDLYFLSIGKTEAAEIVSDLTQRNPPHKKGGGLDKRKRERMGILSKLGDSLSSRPTTKDLAT